MIEAARCILRKMLESPEICDECKKYIWQQGGTHESLKDFISGMEYARKDAHSAGWSKGLATGIITTICIVAVGTFGFLAARKKDII